jgi:hypothetical protein
MHQALNISSLLCINNYYTNIHKTTYFYHIFVIYRSTSYSFFLNLPFTIVEPCIVVSSDDNIITITNYYSL